MKRFHLFLLLIFFFSYFSAVEPVFFTEEVDLEFIPTSLNEKNSKFAAKASFSRHSEEINPTARKLDEKLKLFLPLTKAELKDLDQNTKARKLPLGCRSERALIASRLEDWSRLSQNDLKTVLVVARGGCSFDEKAKVAQEIGVNFLLVFNTEANYYDENLKLKDPCDVDCSVARNNEKVICEENSRCRSELCLEDEVSRDYCCARDDLISMKFEEESVNVDSMFVSTVTGQLLVEFFKADYELNVHLSPHRKSRFEVLWSLGLTWCFVMVIVTTSVLNSARIERNTVLKESSLYKQMMQAGSESERSQLLQQYKQDLRTSEAGISRETFETLEVSSKLIFTSFAAISTILLCIFFITKFYPKEFVVLLIFAFSVGSIYPLSQYLWTPVLKNKSLSECCLFEDNTRWSASSAGFLLSCLTSLYFFLWRHESSINWIIQDIMAFTLICTFLKQVRLDKLELCFKLLALFFVYDVFMTFVTPILFRGHSVMVDVATAGNQESETIKDGQCVREFAEKMPMMFLIPSYPSLFIDPREPEGFSVIGLGDIFLPGLVLAYGLRLDYFKMRADQFDKGVALTKAGFYEGHSYMRSLTLAYALGILATFMANYFHLSLFGVNGQPALLYLSPSILFLLRWRAKVNKEYDFLWDKSLAELDSHLAQISLFREELEQEEVERKRDERRMSQ